jgi:hypothetical protein
MHHTTPLANTRRLVLVAISFGACAFARSAGAQTPAQATIDPGMTREQVVSHLGTPSGESHSGSFTYLFYENGCGQKCGIDDVVVLERNTVTDAIFRSPKRAYTGISSSPQALLPVPTGRYVPAPIRASSPDDSAHRGGIVFMEPRAAARPPQFTRIIPNRADSARMANGGHSGTGTPGGAPASTTPLSGSPGRPDSSPPPPH